MKLSPNHSKNSFLLKKVGFIILFGIFLFVHSWGQLIDVSVDKSRYRPGESITITYDCSPCGGPCDYRERAKIYLHQENIETMGTWFELGTPTPGSTTGTVTITIPASIPDAWNYVITIWRENSCWGRSSVFQITSPPRILRDKVTTPAPGSVLHFGTNFQIRWIRQSEWGDSIEISLRKAENPGQNILIKSLTQGSTINSYNWKVGSCRLPRGVTFQRGSRYRIVVTDMSDDPHPEITSGLFTLRSPKFETRLSNLSEGGVGFLRGHTIRVRWTSEPEVLPGSTYKLVIKFSPNTDRGRALIGSGGMMGIGRTTRREMTWVIPTTYTPGNPVGFPSPDAGRLSCQIIISLKGMPFAEGKTHKFEIE